MIIGKLNRRIVIQSRTTGRDAAGGRTETWGTAFSAWAELIRQKTGEGTVGDAERASDQKQFRIRWRSGLGAGTHRVSYKGQFYDITGIDEEGIETALVLTCINHQSLTA